MIEFMPFGKHRGESFGEMPVDYLIWLTTTELQHKLADEVFEAAAAELERRSARQRKFEWDTFDTRAGARANGASGSRSLLGAQRDWALRIVQAGFRALALQHHPDVGGKTEDMRDLKAAEEAVRRLIGGP